MSNAFDPYEAWLGIPPSKRPPSPHEIIGVEEGETEYERIREATAERYDQVRSLALGPHREHALELLDAISRAFVSLTEDMGVAAAAVKPPPPPPKIDVAPGPPPPPPPGGIRLNSQPIRGRTLDGHPLDGWSPPPSSVHRHTRRRSVVAAVLLAPVVWVDKLLGLIAGRDNTILHGFLRCAAVVVLLVAPLGLSRVRWSWDREPAGAPAVEAVDFHRRPVDGAGSAGGVLLQLCLEEGATYRARVTEETTISALPVFPQDEASVTKVFVISFLVREIESDGTADVWVTFDSAQVRQRGDAGDAEVDPSEAVAGPPVPTTMKTFAALEGAGLGIHVTPQGQITRVAGTDQLVSRILADVGDPEAREEEARREYGPQAIKEMMQEVFATLPGVPVAIGDSWSVESIAARGLGAVVDNTWTLRSRREGVAVLDLRAKVEPNPDAPARGNTKLEYELSGTRSGSVEIDEATGWVEKSMVRLDVEGELRVQGEAGSTKRLIVPVSIERVTHVEHL